MHINIQHKHTYVYTQMWSVNDHDKIGRLDGKTVGRVAFRVAIAVHLDALTTLPLPFPRENASS